MGATRARRSFNVLRGSLAEGRQSGRPSFFHRTGLSMPAPKGESTLPPNSADKGLAVVVDGSPD